MPQGLEFNREWDIKKRKNSVLDNLSISCNDDWDSSSCTAPALKHRKSQLDWQSGGCEEVGNDDFQFMGREFFEPTCIGMEKIRVDEDELQVEKDVVGEIQVNKSINQLETNKIEGHQGTSDRDDQKIHHEPLTVDGNRNCMMSIISELKETREKMIIWMRQEIQKIMNEGSGGPVVRINYAGGQAGGEMEFEEQHGSGQNANSTGVTVLGNGSGEIDFGGETSASGGTEFARQNSLVDGGDFNIRNGNTDLNFGSQNCGRGKEEIGFGKDNENSERMGSGFNAQKSVGQADVGMRARGISEGRMNFNNQSRGHTGGVAMTLQNGSVGVVHLGSQSARDAVVGFTTPSELPGEMAFGAEQTSCGIGLNYTNQNSGGSGMVFGRQSVDSGTRDGAGGRGGVENSNTPVNSACSRQVNAIQLSGEERTSDLIGMQNQNLQSSVGLSMMWNGVVQNPRNVNQDISASGVHGFHFDAHNKLGNGGIGPYRGLVSGSTAYENSRGMMNSPAIQVTPSTLGMHLPMSMQNMTHGNLNSSGIQPLLGIQNQTTTQNFSGMQNFLGLSMNGNMGPSVLGEGINTHVFPGLYRNVNPRHMLAAKSNTLPGSSGMRGRPHKRGSAVHGRDTLELNT